MSVTVSKKRLSLGERADGTPLIMHFLEYRGSTGPSVFIGAGIHGDELTGVACLWKLREHLDGKDLKGTITIMPAMNPEGLNYNIRGMPEEDVDLNRLYPGKPTGSLAERFTAKAWGIAKRHDVIVDLHTYGRSIPFVLLDPVTGELKRRTDELAKATGITVLEELPPEDYAQENLGASLGGVASKEGIPSLTIELGGSRSVDWECAEAGYLALRNLLVYIRAIEGAPTPIRSCPVIREKGYRREDLYSNKGGLVEFVAEPGQKLRKGQLVAKVRDVYGDLVEEIRMPKNGYMVAQSSGHVTETGGAVACVAIPTN